MNADDEKTRRHWNSFVFLKTLSWALFAVAIVVGAVLWALGNSKANDFINGAAIMFIFACILSTTAGYFFNALMIVHLPKRLSALEAGSLNASKGES